MEEVTKVSVASTDSINQIVYPKRVKRLVIDGEVMYFECVSCNSHGNSMSHATVRVKSSSRSQSTFCALPDPKLKLRKWYRRQQIKEICRILDFCRFKHFRMPEYKKKKKQIKIWVRKEKSSCVAVNFCPDRQILGSPISLAI
uniref:Uncharacterized protein n=1 Tax=Romanomermis culicivorax TaxID=13658 RepID=A0A915JKM2_ROMCU